MPRRFPHDLHVTYLYVCPYEFLPELSLEIISLAKESDSAFRVFDLPLYILQLLFSVCYFLLKLASLLLVQLTRCLFQL